ncbi:hypothetical protein [Kluyvera sichuanensis]|uniref:hypothetical protein n=1 Tax=Kluyvera sichuanensis TaxID=2725494 RepID=UPI0039F5AF41
MHDVEQQPETFWESHYDAMSPRSNGIPGKILVRFTESLAPGWEVQFCEEVSRTMTGPEGQRDEVSDAVVALKRG